MTRADFLWAFSKDSWAAEVENLLASAPQLALRLDNRPTSDSVAELSEMFDDLRISMIALPPPCKMPELAELGLDSILPMLMVEVFMLSKVEAVLMLVFELLLVPTLILELRLEALGVSNVLMRDKDSDRPCEVNFPRFTNVFSGTCSLELSSIFACG